MGHFMNWIADNFQKIKTMMSSAIVKRGYDFDEDIFSDTIIKCDKKLEGRILKDDDLLRYLWISFKTNTLRELKYFRNNGTNTFPDNLLTESEENMLFCEVSSLIQDEFGYEAYRLFLLHANGFSYKDLEELTGCGELKYLFRKIREFVRKKLKGELD